MISVGWFPIVLLGVAVIVAFFYVPIFNDLEHWSDLGKFLIVGYERQRGAAYLSDVMRKQIFSLIPSNR